MILLNKKFIRVSNEWITDTSEGNLFRRIGTEGFTIYCVLLYIKGEKNKFQTTIKEMKNILCRNYNKRQKITYSSNKSNYVSVIKESRTIKKYLKLLCEQKLIEVEGNTDKINKVRIDDYIIINVIEPDYIKGFSSITCDLVLDKVHIIGHIGFSLLFILTNLFNGDNIYEAFANPSEEYLGNVIKRDVNTVSVYLYLLQENKLIKILPQAPILLGKDKNNNNIYQYIPNHYIVNNKLPGNEYNKNKKRYRRKDNKEKEELAQIQLNEEEVNILKLMPYNEYLQTEHWKNKREQALNRANYKCQLCSNKYDLHVHHNTYENRGNEKDEDLIVLCEDCHKKFHNK